MKMRSSSNVRIRRKYLLWLKEARGLSDASVDRAAASIARFEAVTGGADFKSFHVEKARAFKRRLESETNARTGRPLSAGLIDGTLRDLKAFFGWLADQPSYRSKLSHADAAYFTPSRRVAKSAHGGAWRDHPSPEQAAHAVRSMPGETLIERRDRAMMALLYLTGGRDGALITLRIRNIDLRGRCVHFSGRDVETKFGKMFTSWFFPIGEEFEQYVAEWVSELREKLFFGPGDPVFPRQATGLGEDGSFAAQGLERAPYANTARVAAICKSAFEGAGLPAFTPHLLRKTLVDLASSHCRTPEEFKAWSQNLGHEDVMTTFRSYGAVAPGRQRDLIYRMRPVDEEEGEALFDPC